MGRYMNRDVGRGRRRGKGNGGVGITEGRGEGEGRRANVGRDWGDRRN